MRQVLDRRFPIRGPVAMMTVRARHALTVVDLNGVGLAVARELFGALRNDHLRSELPCLGVRPSCKSLTRDAGRKAKIVFDLRAGTGLSSGRARLQYQNIQAFRSGVHRRRKSRGSRTHDDNVAYLGLVDCLVKTEAIGDLLIGRIPQHSLATTNQTGTSAALT